MFLTIFTPTYNRAYCLGNLYDSLVGQEDKDFEWVIVDDGSTDGTETLVKSWIGENRIDIKYFKQPNAGKHSAINRGVKAACGDFFFIVDSDDRLAGDAVRNIKVFAMQIADRDDFAGVSGLRIHSDTTKISQGINRSVIDGTSLDFRYRYNIKGDLAEVFKTKVMRRYPFPEFKHERFVPEALVWNRIAHDGLKLRLFDKGIYICEYLADGLTAGIIRVRMNSPIASTTYYAELIQLDIPYTSKIKAAINYWRFYRRNTSGIKRISVRWMWLRPMGYLFHLLDLRQNKK